MAKTEDDVVLVNTQELDAKSEELNNKTSTQQENPKRVDGSEFYKHPEIVPAYVFLKDARTGGGGCRGVSNQNNSNGSDVSYYTYLPYGPAEKYYKNRIDKTIWYDDFSDFIDSLYKKIFAKDLSFVSKNPDTQKWLEDVNGYGWDIKKYSEMMCRNLATFDFTINILEKEKENNILYLVNKNWEDLVHYVVEDRKFKSVVFKATSSEIAQAMEYLSENNKRFVKYNANKGNEKVFTKYFINEDDNAAKVLIIKKNNKYDPITESMVDFGIDELPIQLLNYTIPDKPELAFNERPRQFVIAKSLWYIWMRSSIKDRLLDAQGFDTLVLPQGTRGNDALSAIETPRNATVTPTVLSPDADKPRVHLENIDRATEKYRSLVEKFGVIVYTETEESGYAKSFRYEAKNETLNTMVQDIREFLDWLESITAKYHGESTTTNREIEDNMSRDYMPETPMVVDDILKLVDLAKTEKMDLFYKEILKIMTNKFGKGIVDANRKLVISEIENLNFSDNE
jgi:hypothetical protein